MIIANDFIDFIQYMAKSDVEFCLTGSRAFEVAFSSRSDWDFFVNSCPDLKLVLCNEHFGFEVLSESYAGQKLDSMTECVLRRVFYDGSEEGIQVDVQLIKNFEVKLIAQNKIKKLYKAGKIDYSSINCGVWELAYDAVRNK